MMANPHATPPASGGTLITRRHALMLGGLAAFSTLLSGARFAQAEPAPSSSAERPFEILIIIYPDGTLLDFAGPNEVFQRLKNTKVRYASPQGGLVTMEHGIVFGPTERLAEVKHADLILVPGGTDVSSVTKPEMLAHIRRLAEDAEYVTSVCTGSIVLAAAGLLQGKRSACHWACLNLLKEYGAIPDPARFVKDGRFMSGGGVTSGIDFALRVAAELQGRPAAEFAQLVIEYDPAPPFQGGHPRHASPAVLDLFEQSYPGAKQGLLNIKR